MDFFKARVTAVGGGTHAQRSQTGAWVCDGDEGRSSKSAASAPRLEAVIDCEPD